MVIDSDQLRKMFPPGSSVIIEIVAEDGNISRYNSRVEDLEGTYLVLQTPSTGGAYLHIQEGQELTISSNDNIDKKNFVTSVFVVENRPGRQLLVCSDLLEIGRSSKRRFSRFYVDLPFHCSTSKAESTGRITNLSLCGFNAVLEYNTQISVGDQLIVRISITGGTDLKINGRVIRAYGLPGNSEMGIAVAFLRVDNKMRDLLKDYLFQCQLLEKGILGKRVH